VWIAALAGCSEDTLRSYDKEDSEDSDEHGGGVLKEAERQDYLVTWGGGSEENGTSPLSLTASDGTGLELKSLKTKTVIEGPLAFTEIELKFENPLNRVLEGRFEITLPPSAAISRLAMRIGKKWQEAEVVEKQEARRAYEDFLHRNQDPLLMEKKAGNQFRARVFPIPARATKDIIFSYSQELRNVSEPYLLLLHSLPELDEFDVDINFTRSDSGSITTDIDGAVVKGRRFHFNAAKFAPPGNVEVHLPHDKTPLGLRHGNIAMARVTPSLDTTQVPINNLTVLFDTSASRAVGFKNQVSRLAEILRHLETENERDIDLRILCFDQDVDLVFTGLAGEFDHVASNAIIEREALGASDLENALRFVAKSPGGYNRLLVFTDGIITAGKKEAKHLLWARAALEDAGFSRVDVVVGGDVLDETKLKVLIQGEQTEDGVIVKADAPIQKVVSKLRSRTFSNIGIGVPGASWFWPKEVNGIQPGDQVLVFADLSLDEPLKIEFEGLHTEVFEITTSPTERPLLERAWARSSIERLEGLLSATDVFQDKQLLTKEIIRLSTKYRVLSDSTALLVLETEQDYRRFGIDRKSLSDILTVGPRGIDVLKRSKAVYTEGSGASSQKWEDFGYGGLGLSGYGRGGGGHGEGTIGLGSLNTIGRGGGRGSGKLMARRAAVAPMIRASACRVMGSLPRHVIQRIVRRRTNELRGCYNDELRMDPNVSGRISIQFLIDGAGRVVTAGVKESTVRNPTMEACVVRAIETWEFPNPPGGGAVVVTYPFTFSTWKSQQLASQRGEIDVHENPRSQAIIPSDSDSQTTVTDSGSPGNSSTSGSDTNQASNQHHAQESNSSGIGVTPPVKSKPPIRRRILHYENAYKGQLQQIMRLISKKQNEQALEQAWDWRHKEPENVMALVGLGESLESLGARALAARVYGSIIDLFPSRADMRRMSGQRLERLRRYGITLALDTYREAAKQRPDHFTGHRLYAYALVKVGRYRKAIKILIRQLEEGSLDPEGREQVLEEDISLISAAWLAHRPKDTDRIHEVLLKHNLEVSAEPSVRFVLYWESDANDVDLHVYDHDGYENHAFYSEPSLPSGGDLYGDITNGYGPECFALDDEADGYPYRIQAHYYSRGPMGYGMGKLQVIRHDGKGNLRFSERPFVIMRDGAYVNLGVVRNKRSKVRAG